MKKYIIVIPLLLSVVSDAQWVKLPSFSALKTDSRIQFLDSNNGWVHYTAEFYANLFQTIDGGKSWKEVSPSYQGRGSQSNLFVFYE